MIGDVADMAQRIRQSLPSRWFSDVAPILDATLSGLGSTWSQIFFLVGQVKLQRRLATVSSGFMDLAARDFFGPSVARRSNEGDDAFRTRIGHAVVRSRGTRAAVIDAAAVAGFSVTVFEAARPADTGAYSVTSSLAWGRAGAWGSLAMPLECLIVSTRGAGAVETELRQSVADAMPAGGVAWLRIAD